MPTDYLRNAPKTAVVIAVFVVLLVWVIFNLFIVVEPPSVTRILAYLTATAIANHNATVEASINETQKAQMGAD